jgi:hypothetical protein
MTSNVMHKIIYNLNIPEADSIAETKTNWESLSMELDNDVVERYSDRDSISIVEERVDESRKKKLLSLF